MKEIKDKNGKILGIVNNIYEISNGLNFYTENSESIQVASFCYDEGVEMRDHKHLWHDVPSKQKTQEILIVFFGEVELRVFDENEEFVDRFILNIGDFYISLYGGVGYTILKNHTHLLEVKSGPFYGSEIDRKLI